MPRVWQKIDVRRHFCHCWQEFDPGRITAMTNIELLLSATAVLATVWFLVHLVSLIKSDGYGFRSSSGLPKDWAPPELDLPSVPYSVKPHR
jgi:hypothetical protein